VRGGILIPITMTTFELTREERAVYRRLQTPEKIQRFLDEEVAYNKEPHGPTSKGPRPVIRDRVGHCMEGALFGAAALQMQGHEPLILDLESVRDDDHVLAVFRRRGHWGAIAKSNYSGLRFREPVYRNLRELVMSYFEHYYNLRREKTLRAFSTRPVNVRRFDSIEWLTAGRDLWEIPEYLVEVKHSRLMTLEMEANLTRMDRRLFDAGRLGAAV